MKRPAFLGILMLETQFPRPLGDVGHPQTFERHGVPTRRVVVPGASPQRIVSARDPTLLVPFVAAAQALEREGAQLLTTSCGFLAAWQRELQAAVGVPLVASSLQACRTQRSPGIVTIDAQALDDRVMLGVGAALDTPRQGVNPQGELATQVLGNHATLNEALASAEVVDAARALLQRHPGVQTIVLECTNMPPYRAAVQAATQRTVVDIETELLAAWRQIL